MALLWGNLQQFVSFKLFKWLKKRYGSKLSKDNQQQGVTIRV